MAHHDADHHDHYDDGGQATDSLIELLDLDGEVLATYLHDVTTWVREHVAGDARRLLDLGCGTGTATFAFALQFPESELVALDASTDMLARVRAKADAQHLGDRLRCVHADLDDGWPAIGSLDLVWASLSLHHVADPGLVLEQIYAAVNPGGLLAVAEMADQLRFLPDDIGLGRPGLETRVNAVLAELHAQEVPNLGRDWPELLERAGFTVEAERPFLIDLRAPLPAASGRYAQAWLRRVRPRVDRQLAEDDLTTLDTLIADDGPHSVLRRGDLHLRATRTGFLARRP